MKQITREKRRIEREEREKIIKIMNEEENKNRMIKYEKRRKEQQKDFWTCVVKWIFWICVVIGIVSVINHYDNNQQEQYKAKIDAKLSIWNEYKDKNCKEVEKIFGMQMGSGKLAYVDNGKAYQCENGIKYTISDKVEKGESGLDSIPSIPNP